MTLKEAILKSLEEIDGLSNYFTILRMQKEFSDFCDECLANDSEVEKYCK